MTWWSYEGNGLRGGALELDGLEVELVLRFTPDGRTLAWWVESQTGAWLRRAAVGSA
jgi:hypothetical protein